MIKFRVYPNLKWLLFLVFLLPLYRLSAQRPIGARENGMGGVSVCSSGPFTTFNNPAAAAMNASFQAGISHTRHYLLKELSTSGVSLCWPASFGAISAGFIQTGITEMKHNMLVVSYARQFGKILMSGLSLTYFYLSAPENGKKYQSATFSAGFVIRTASKLNAAVSIFNPFPATLPFNNILLIPSIYRLGFQYLLNEKGSLSAETEKVTGKPISARIGFEYGLAKVAVVRSGIRINPLEWSFGAGIILGSFQLDIASTLHPALGITPEVSVIYKIRKNEK